MSKKKGGVCQGLGREMRNYLTGTRFPSGRGTVLAVDGGDCAEGHEAVHRNTVKMVNLCDMDFTRLKIIIISYRETQRIKDSQGDPENEEQAGGAYATKYQTSVPMITELVGVGSWSMNRPRDRAVQKQLAQAHKVEKGWFCNKCCRSAWTAKGEKPRTLIP